MMPEHRYAVGNYVYVSSTSLSGPAVADAFEILHLYPGDVRGPMYRLRSLMSRHERMAPGRELRPMRNFRAAADGLVEPAAI